MDLMDADLPAGTYDLVYARWVFCFLPNPEAGIGALADALAPGGVMAIQDYSHRASFSVYPRPQDWSDFLEADRRFFAAEGGDIDVGGRLPESCERAGLEVVDVTPIHTCGRPDSLVWRWLWEYAQSVQDTLAGIAPLDARKMDRLMHEWSVAAENRWSFVTAPTLVDVVAKRPEP